MVRFSPAPARTDPAQIRQAAPGPLTAKAHSTARPGARLNTVTGRLLVGLVLLCAIPVASNRPAWWLLWTLLLGLWGLVYLVRAHQLARGRRLQISQFRLFLSLALLVPLYALVQSLPLAGHLPAVLQALPPDLPAALRPDSISLMPGASLLGAIRAVGFLLFLVLVIEVATNPARIHALGLLLLAGIVLHALFGLVALRLLDDFAIWGDKTAYQGMLTGTFVNRNSAATFLGFGVVLAIAFALDRGQRAAALGLGRGYHSLLTPPRLESVALWLVAALLALAVVLTQSRMGTVATAVGGGVTFVALRLGHRLPWPRVLAEAAIAAVVLALLVMPTVGSGLVERALFTLTEGASRVSLYAQIWGMIQQRPLTGFGYDAFAPAYELYRAPPFVSDHYVELAHNTYLALWAEQGVIFGSLPMALTLWAGAMIVQRLRSGSGDRAMGAAALGALTLGGLHSLADFSLEIPANVYCFLLIVGLAMARPRLSGAGPVPKDKAQPEFSPYVGRTFA